MDGVTIDVVVAVSPDGNTVVDMAVEGKLASVVTTVVDFALDDTKFNDLDNEADFSPSAFFSD
jgi:hypothetical protein